MTSVYDDEACKDCSDHGIQQDVLQEEAAEAPMHPIDEDSEHR